LIQLEAGVFGHVTQLASLHAAVLVAPRAIIGEARVHRHTGERKDAGQRLSGADHDVSGLCKRSPADERRRHDRRADRSDNLTSR
jgi:hypothetical protein